MKGPSERPLEGIFGNPLFLHTSAALMGCVVQIHVKNGSIFEGIFRTFSHKMEIVLEMAHKLESKKSNNIGYSVNTMLPSVTSSDDITDNIIFRPEDIVHISALNTDPDFASRETFTDTAISKFNGQVQQRELEPWDAGELTTEDGLAGLGTEGEESNGWDPNEMFRTNEEKYGVKSSFDSELPGYTIALEKRNTEEYKQQEAKASKIAEMIESGVYHGSRNALENGDEEDMFSAVVRPENSNSVEACNIENKWTEAKASNISQENVNGHNSKSQNAFNNGHENWSNPNVRVNGARNFVDTRNAISRQPETAKASKITQENEIGYSHKSRYVPENGYEKRYNSNSRINDSRFPPRKRPTQGMRGNTRSSPSPSHPGSRSSNHSFQHHQQQIPPPIPPHRVSSPAVPVPPSGYKTASSTSSASCVSTPSPRPTPSSTPTPRHPAVSPVMLPPPNQLLQHPLQAQPPPPLTSNMHPVVTNLPLTHNQDPNDHKINREVDKVDQKPQRDFEPKPPRDLEPKPPRDLEPKSPRDLEPKPPRLSNQQTNIPDRRKDGEKKMSGQKARDDKTEDLKKFHAKFKLSEDIENKEHKEEMLKLEASIVSSTISGAVPSKPCATQEKDQAKEEESKMERPEDLDTAEAIGASSLNPNAKEFVLNPNAETFTPRNGPPSGGGAPPPAPPMQPPPRLHSQSPVMAVAQPHLMPGMGQPIFANMPQHYVVSTTPVSVPLGSPYTPTASMSHPPRYRRAVPMTLQRHEMSQAVHVQAATGPPILAQPTLSTPQFAIQYPGMMHHPQGHPQPTIGYAQMYSVMTSPRVLNPQAVGIVPTSSYGESPHVPTHLYMTHPGTQNVSHVPPGNAGQHSSSSTPQSQTPALHPSPSPVHQPPPSHANHGQPPTPTGHPGNAPTPQPVIYGHIAPQHPVHSNPQSGNQPHPYPTSFPGTPQPIMLLPQQAVSGGHGPHPGTFSATLQNHILHGQQQGNHGGNPTHVLPHPPMAMIPTSAAMVHTQNIQSGHFAPHTQVPRSSGVNLSWNLGGLNRDH